MRRAFLALSNALYTAVRPALFRQTAQQAHETLLEQLAKFDNDDNVVAWLKRAHRWTSVHRPIEVGGTVLDYPLMMAAGFVKGHGYADESHALEAVQRGINIIPGWRSVPVLVGTVEFGSFTRHPRLGNDGTVLWRHAKSHSLQNRIGLKNPGVVAASEFLRLHKLDLPPIYGINIATTPALHDINAQVDEVLFGVHAFLDNGIVPSWFTLNLSCPNTEDDPHGNQTEALAHQLSFALVSDLSDSPYNVPLWVKVGPDLSNEQLRILVNVFSQTGVRAVVATNTLGQPAPDNPKLQAGMSGKSLFPHALRTARVLNEARFAAHAHLDIVACGGIVDGKSYLAYKSLGINVAQCWSAFIYRGPLALQLIESEAHD